MAKIGKESIKCYYLDHLALLQKSTNKNCICHGQFLIYKITQWKRAGLSLAS